MSTKISVATTKNTVTVNGETKTVSVVTAGAQGAKGYRYWMKAIELMAVSYVLVVLLKVTLQIQQLLQRN